MINHCHKCGISPIVNVMVKCRNEECEIFDEPYLVYTWQKLKITHEDKYLEAQFSLEGER